MGGYFGATDCIYSKQGDALFKAGKFDDAKKSYWEQASKLVGPRFRIPCIAGVGDGGVRSDRYTEMDHYDRANLMGCCSGIAKCFIREGDIESVCFIFKFSELLPYLFWVLINLCLKALAWLEEVSALYRNTYFSTDVPFYGKPRFWL